MSFGAGAPIPVEFVLLRGSLFADIALKPGSMVSGRVLEMFGNGRGLMTLGGVKVDAQLPDNVRAGNVLRMQVTESLDERLTLRVVEQLQPQAAQATGALAQMPLVGMPLPGGATARILVDPEETSEGGSRGGENSVRTLVLRYDSDLLGRMDVVVRLQDEQVTATVLATPGEPVTAAREGADELRGKLREAASRPAQVIISGRAEALNVQA
ncbi:MAG: hypothetical protein JHC95_16790 [Solirubrobacteraceae bacterium]|nr:hypothetical protein [Solirubrobacteraceae bacterium]